MVLLFIRTKHKTIDVTGRHKHNNMFSHKAIATAYKTTSFLIAFIMEWSREMRLGMNNILWIFCQSTNWYPCDEPCYDWEIVVLHACFLVFYYTDMMHVILLESPCDALSIDVTFKTTYIYFMYRLCYAVYVNLHNLDKAQPMDWGINT